MLRWIKNVYHFYEHPILFGSAIFLVASIAFALGYLANREYRHIPIIIEKCSTATSSSP